MSVNYQDWKVKRVSVGGLFLDPENPRIPPGRKLSGERALIEELAIHEDIFSLAKNITDNGFFPSEPLVAVKENGKTIVVEGNRRLSACKILMTPTLAPKDSIKRFRSLSATFDKRLLAKLPVVIAPSREATIPLIIARHTATQIAKWQPAMQAHFYSNLLTHGLSIDEVAEKFSLKPSEIREAIHAHNLYKMACRLPLDEQASEIVNDPRKFNLTTLSRVFDTPFAKQFFGVEFSETGAIRGGIAADEFKKGFSRLVSDIATGNEDSRTLHKAEDIKGYLEKLPVGQRPNTQKKGSFDSDTFLASKASSPVTPMPKPKKPKGRGVGLGLIPLSMTCGSTNQRVRNLFKELQKLPPSKFPNACAFTFRSFIEISVYCFLDANGEIAKMQQEYIAEIQKANVIKPPDKQRKPEPYWTPNLNGMLKRLAQPTHNLLSNQQTAKALNKVVGEESELFGLNLSTHNPTYHPSEFRLRHTWSNLEELFREILT